MLTFNLNRAPPTLVEIGKEGSRLKRNMSLSLILVVVLLLVAYAPTLVPSLKPYLDYGLGSVVFTLRLILAMITTILLAVPVGLKIQAENLSPISKADCFDIAKGLNQRIIATYCAHVAAQGRELVAGEYDAIIRQIQIKEAESFKLQTEAELETACKKVYGVTAP